jgi:hypothetical protein
VWSFKYEKIDELEECNSKLEKVIDINEDGICRWNFKNKRVFEFFDVRYLQGGNKFVNNLGVLIEWYLDDWWDEISLFCVNKGKNRVNKGYGWLGTGDIGWDTNINY